MTTIRETQERILAEHFENPTHGLCDAGCAGSWPCTANREALAGLAILDNAPLETVNSSGCVPIITGRRMVPDPERDS